jgi:hypothetical protein
MPRILLANMVVVTTILAVCGCLRVPPDSKFEGDGFSVVAPATFQKSVKSVDVSPVGKMNYIEYTAKHGNLEYSIACVDYPQELVNKSDPDKILDGSRDGAVNNVNGKLALEEKITFDGHPGRKLGINMKGNKGQNLTLKCRIFLVGNRLYFVGATAPKGEVSISEMDAFLDSFRLLKK